MLIKEVATHYLVYYKYANKEQCTEATSQTEDVLQLILESVVENKAQPSSTSDEKNLRYSMKRCID